MRLINFSIISGALAAGLIAGPSVGGSEFIDFVENIPCFGIPVWQALCLAATILSITAVVINGMRNPTT